MNILSEAVKPLSPNVDLVVHSHRQIATPWSNLVWKEWHEHKWKTALITLFAVGGVLLAGGQAKDTELAGLFGCAGVIFMAMSVVAGERVDGTLDFAQSLPIALWKTAFVRMAVSGLLCVVPILVSAIVVQIAMFMTGNHNLDGLWTIAFRNCGFCLCLYYWITAATVLQPTPLRVGMVGVCVVLMWLTIGLVLSILQDKSGETWVQIAGWLGPGGWENPEAMSSSARAAGVLGWQVLSMALLFYASVVGYGTPLSKPRNLVTSSAPMSLGRPRRSSTTALAWLQFQESLTLCIAGAALMLLIGLVSATVFAQDLSLLKRSNIVVMTVFAVGVPWMAVVAVGTFVPNLQRRLFTFWRSQPIVVGEWYWSKFWIGAAVALVSLHLPVILVVGVTQKMCWLDPVAGCVGYLVFPLIHLMVYSLSVFASALFRNVTQAAILSTAASLLLICPPLMPDSSVKFLRYDLAQTAITDFVASGFTSSIIAAVPILCGVIVVTSAAAVAGVVAVQRDVSVGKM